jgi:hypothetical protein
VVFSGPKSRPSFMCGALSESRGPEHELGFLMYPQAERASLLLDCLDPDKFRYTLTSKEVTAS